jgi:hypothetical protein
MGFAELSTEDLFLLVDEGKNERLTAFKGVMEVRVLSL